jgi:hypothetical protein
MVNTTGRQSTKKPALDVDGAQVVFNPPSEEECNSL